MTSPLRFRFHSYPIGGGAGSGGGLGDAQLQVAGMLATGNRSRDARDYYTPGNGSPGVSTAEYYHMQSLLFFRPYDLDSMGADGAAVKADNGGNRYAWIVSADHPEGGARIHTDSWGFKLGFSNDPSIPPIVMVDIIPAQGQWTGDATTPGANGYTIITDFCPSALVHNPDDASFPFYLYVQGIPTTGNIGTQSIVMKSSDLFDWVGCAWGPKPNVTASDDGEANADPLTSYQMVFRNGTGDWNTFGTVGTLGRIGMGQWVSTDGKTWAYASTIYNITGQPSVNLSIDAGSGNPGRLTASSAIFSPSDDGKGLNLTSPTDVIHYLNLQLVHYVNSTTVDLTYWDQAGSNNFLTFSNAAAPVEFGTISYRNGPGPGIDRVGILGAWGTPFTPGDSAQLYQVCNEDARQISEGMWTTLAAIDADYNVSQVVPMIRLSSQYSGFFSGVGYIINVMNYEEDGISFIFTGLGVPGPHTTASTPYVGATVVGGVTSTQFDVDSVAAGDFIPIGGFVTGPIDYVGQIVSQTSSTESGGALGGAGVYVIENPGSVTIAAHTANILVNSGTYNQSSSNAGRFDNHFIDHYTMAYDSAAASRAAPFGVSISCSNNVVTLAWMDTPLGVGAESQSYNIYKGTSSGTQATFVGNTASLTTTDSPTPGQQWWYKVVKVSGGVEYLAKNRVVHTYVG